MHELIGTMKLPLMSFTCAKCFCAAFIASAFRLPILHALPRVSLNIERLGFNGNLLKFPDGSFIPERYGELYRLGPNGQVERKLPFDPLHPVPEITASNTWFRKLLAPLTDGGFFAVVISRSRTLVSAGFETALSDLTAMDGCFGLLIGHTTRSAQASNFLMVLYYSDRVILRIARSGLFACSWFSVSYSANGGPTELSFRAGSEK